MSDRQVKPRRVIYVLFRYPQLSQTFVRDEIAALRNAGTDVTVLSLDEPDSDTPPAEWAGPYRQVRRPGNREAVVSLLWWLRRRPMGVARLLVLAAREPTRRRYMLTRVPAMTRSLMSDSATHVHTHFAWDTATVTSAIAALLDVPATATVHAKDLYAQPAATVRRRLTRFEEVVTVCNFNVGYLQGSGTAGQDGGPPVRVIPCGVAVPDDPAPHVTDDVVSVGRLIEKKGFDVLLRALAALGGGWEQATIVGDGPERGRLEALAQELGLSGRVRFAGALPHAEALAHIAAARVFCLPARPAPDGDSDAMPVVIREAMARAVPVVATRLAGIPESVDEEVGWLADPGSVTSLTTALRAALSDEGERDRRGRQARDRAARLWTFPGQAKALDDVFAAATARRVTSR
jgi:colanic acid/amylovoran biosynthesis glycosyltransferase